MNLFNLTEEQRADIGESAVKLLEKYDAELGKEMLKLSKKYDVTETREALTEYSPMFIQEEESILKLYKLHKSINGENALPELNQKLQPLVTETVSQCSRIIETKHQEEELIKKSSESLGILKEELSKPLGIIKLDSRITALLYPRAQFRFNNWREELNKEVPELEELTIEQIVEDLDDHLDDNKKNSATKYEETIKGWLYECIDQGDGFKLVADSPPFADMSSLKGLLREVYKCKKIKAEEKQAKELKEKRIDEAYDTLGRPFYDDAKRYLPKEVDEFSGSLKEAVNFHIKKDGKYNWSDLPYRYRSQVELIHHLKAKEQQQIQIRNDAQAQATAFGPTLVQGLKEIEKMLSPKKEDSTVVFKRRCSDNGEKRYLGEPFSDILAKNSNWTEGYITPAEDDLRQSIPEELYDFILMETTRNFFLLPEAHYGHYGVPCLDIYFNVFAVVTIKVLAKAGKKVFNGYAFDFLANLREPKCLGFYQITITPNQPTFWQSVPLIILYALMDGNLQPPGTTILQRTDQLTVYEVNKFEDDICEIPISLERWCRNSGSMEKLKEATVIDGRTAEILEPLRPISINHKESKGKKAKAFQLFSEGKRPGDSEVKSLGIKPNSAYRYYQHWKKAHYTSNDIT